jgi:hypothetical protein
MAPGFCPLGIRKKGKNILSYGDKLTEGVVPFLITSFINPAQGSPRTDRAANLLSRQFIRHHYIDI